MGFAIEGSWRGESIWAEAGDGEMMGDGLKIKLGFIRFYPHLVLSLSEETGQHPRSDELSLSFFNHV